jgi:hypothetical protein
MFWKKAWKNRGFCKNIFPSLYLLAPTRVVSTSAGQRIRHRIGAIKPTNIQTDHRGLRG